MTSRLSVERILAPNPGLFTGPGTNTYLADGGDGLVVIDPGPVDSTHEQAIVMAVGGRRVDAVLVTHTHVDHAPLANPLARTWGVPAFGFGPGPGFEPDLPLGDGDTVQVGAFDLECIHTPGHADDHLCFLGDGRLFTGDHIMGGSSVMVDDVAAYMRSLDRVRSLGVEHMYPGHGPEIDRPAEVVSWYIAHRLEREAAILAAVREGVPTVGGVVEKVYVDVDSSLHPLAARSVIAHLVKLADDGLVRFEGDDWGSPVEVP